MKKLFLILFLLASIACFADDYLGSTQVLLASGSAPILIYPGGGLTQGHIETTDFISVTYASSTTGIPGGASYTWTIQGNQPFILTVAANIATATIYWR